MPTSRLLKSCAIPPASTASDSSFCVRTSESAARFRSVMSRPVTSTPRRLPSSSWTAAYETSNVRCRGPMDVVRSSDTVSPAFARRSSSGSSGLPSGGMISLHGRPMKSPAPFSASRSCCPAGFRRSTRPSVSRSTSASCELAKTASRSAVRSRIAASARSCSVMSVAVLAMPTTLPSVSRSGNAERMTSTLWPSLCRR